MSKFENKRSQEEERTNIESAPSIFEVYLRRWDLTPNGAPLKSASSDLLPVFCGGTSAFLKLPRVAEERRGSRLLLWWNGDGAVRVLAHDDHAVLLERATGPLSLVDMAHQDRDEEACRIICGVAAKLHAPRPNPPPDLVPLTIWFRELSPAASTFGGVLTEAAAIASRLLREPRDTVVLHGDLHHQNVLDGGSRGWLAIDPKALLGERGFDFANIFCNPDLETATAPGRVARLATEIAKTANLDRQRLLQWVLAYAGLSAAWSLSTDDEDPTVALEVGRIASAELASA